MRPKASLLLLCCVLMLFCACKEKVDETKHATLNEEFISPLGKTLKSAEPSSNMLALYKEAKSTFEANPHSVEHHIWFGRRAAYLGHYNEAIQIFSKAIENYPNEPRLYRHRGHRYITLRKIDLAILDLVKASNLIKGHKNSVEPDGLPNALNIPISTLHGNIYYHLGLAYYLKHNYEMAYINFKKCLESGNNDDNVVSSTHWLYMIQQRLKRPDLALKELTPITDSLSIIENMDYYKLCKFYKGLMVIDSLKTNNKGSGSDALNYGLGNWYFVHQNKEKAKEIFDTIIASNTWNSFGYIAAESDIITYY